MRKPGRVQLAVLQAVCESPQPMDKFSSVKNVLDTLQDRNLIKITEETVSLTETGKEAVKIFIKHSKSRHLENTRIKSDGGDKVELLERNMDLLKKTISGAI
jgi:predicted methyltransferase